MYKSVRKHMEKKQGHGLFHVEGKNAKEIESAIEAREIKIYDLNEKVASLEAELLLIKSGGASGNQEGEQKVVRFACAMICIDGLDTGYERRPSSAAQERDRRAKQETTRTRKHSQGSTSGRTGNKKITHPSRKKPRTQKRSSSNYATNSSSVTST